MTFWSDPEKRHSIGRLGHDWVQKHLESLPGMVKSYAGRHHMEGWSDPDDVEQTLENTANEYLGVVKPLMASANPKFKIKTRRGERSALEAKSLELAVNQIIEDIDWRKFLANGPLVDMQFKFGVTLTVPEPLPEYRATEYAFMEEGQHWPTSYRISPNDYFEDPSATDRDGVRFNGWRGIESRADLLAYAEDDKTWHKDAIEMLETGAIAESRKHNEYSRPTLEEMDEVQVMYLFVPESDEGVTLDLEPHPGPREGYNGTLYTMDWDSGDELREPIAWFGTSVGPLTVYAAVNIPDDAVPTGPLTVVWEQHLNLNRQAAAIQRANENYKRMFLYDAKNKRLGDTIKNNPHDWFGPVRNFDSGKVGTYEFGGSADAQHVGFAQAKDTRDRALSFHDQDRGIAPKSTTATAVNAAGQSTTVRRQGIQDGFHDGVRADGMKFLHYALFDRRLAVTISPELLQEYGKELPLVPLMEDDGTPVMDMGQPVMAPPGESGAPVVFRGGEGDGITWADLDATLVSSSMSLTEQGLETAQQLEGIREARGLAMALIQAPELAQFYNVKEDLKQLADIYKNPALATFVDVDRLLSRPPTPAADPKRLEPTGGSKPRYSLGGGSSNGSGRPPTPTFGEGKGGVGAFSGSLTGAQASKVQGP